jgi:hypothetical protein
MKKCQFYNCLLVLDTNICSIFAADCTTVLTCNDYSDFGGFFLEECVMDAYLTRHCGWKLIVGHCNGSPCTGTIHCIGNMILCNKDEFKCIYIYFTL